MVGRRKFLGALAALGVSQVCPARANVSKISFDSYPFELGVASGYPSPAGFVLWTRLVGNFDAVAIPVHYEIFSDDGARTPVFSGETLAEPGWAHSVHVEVTGLEPGRWYGYRFRAGNAQSPPGRTRTAPHPATRPERLRFAFASCQHFEQGHFNAYRHIVADQPDLLAFLGDYIYESSWGRKRIRRHDSGEPYSLEEYRARYALYRSDPDLQAAHAACPWVVTWDDHEVDNDYADDRPEDGMDREQFLLRRAAAYRAFYEHMPLPARMQPQGPGMRLYTQLAWGSLARFYLLDNRQYRSWHACRRPGRSGGSNTVNVEHCARLGAPGRSMLGRAQERWLDRAMSESRAGWNILAQATLMAQFDRQPGPGRRAWTDAWDGYPAARSRLLQSVVANRVSNPVVIGGDLHSFNVCNLKLDFDDPNSPVIASEFVGTSITSESYQPERLAQYLPDNPHVLLADGRYRGYTRVEITPGSWKADLRAVQSVHDLGADCRTLASFVVEEGRPGPIRV